MGPRMAEAENTATARTASEWSVRLFDLLLAEHEAFGASPPDQAARSDAYYAVRQHLALHAAPKRFVSRVHAEAARMCGLRP